MFGVKLRNRKAGKRLFLSKFQENNSWRGPSVCVWWVCDVVVEILCGGRNWRLRGRRGEQVRKRE